MKNQLNPRQWRGVAGRCYKLAERIEACANEIRYANKPADLVFPTYLLIKFSIRARDEQMEWLERLLKLNPAERGRWPRL